jgi:hypothetical protein
LFQGFEIVERESKIENWKSKMPKPRAANNAGLSSNFFEPSVESRRAV